MGNSIVWGKGDIHRGGNPDMDTPFNGGTSDHVCPPHVKVKQW